MKKRSLDGIHAVVKYIKVPTSLIVDKLEVNNVPKYNVFLKPSPFLVPKRNTAFSQQKLMFHENLYLETLVGLFFIRGKGLASQ